MARRLKHETRIFLLTLLSGAPAAGLFLWMLWRSDFSVPVRYALGAVAVFAGWGGAWLVREQVIRPLQTASNLLSALREQDFSVRARSPRHDDALGELMTEVNALSQTLREQRLGALEASALLRTVMFEIEVAIFSFDEAQGLKLVNRAGEKLLARPAEQLLGRTAPALGFADLLNGEASRTAALNLPGGSGRWGIRRSTFRQEGRPHQLLVMTDLSRALRDEERQAWQRIVRVIGHELNNSLAPIKSIAGTLGSVMSKLPRPEDWEEDVQKGLGIIASRADALSRFMEAYARLARLPPPRLRPVDIGACVQRVAQLETRLPVRIDSGPEIQIQADGDQLEQLLINLVRNAVDASLEIPERAEVRIAWARRTDALELKVIDSGPGIPDSANLFVPFFTTKSTGTGLGLVLSRQIAEAHGGNLTLQNVATGQGCVALVCLPLA